MSKKIDDLEAKLAADKVAVAAAQTPNNPARDVNALKDEQARTEAALNAARMDRDPPRTSTHVDSLAAEVVTNKRALEIAMSADAAARAGEPRVAELREALKKSESALAAARRTAVLADNEEPYPNDDSPLNSRRTGNPNTYDANSYDANSYNPNNYDAWATGQSYSVGKKVHDAPSGGCWECMVAHTSGGGTMAQDRAANPGHWRTI